MIFKGVARVEEHNGHMLHSAKLSIHAPSVIRLTEYKHIPFERRSLSRKNILLRDSFDLSVLRPAVSAFRADTRSRHAPLPLAENQRGTIWLLAVSAAPSKGSRTPEESGMHLLRRPRGFSLHVNRQIMRYLGRADETWRKYLFYESNNGG